MTGFELKYVVNKKSSDEGINVVDPISYDSTLNLVIIHLVGE